MTDTVHQQSGWSGHVFAFFQDVDQDVMPKSGVSSCLGPGWSWWLQSWLILVVQVVVGPGCLGPCGPGPGCPGLGWSWSPTAWLVLVAQVLVCHGSPGPGWS